MYNYKEQVENDVRDWVKDHSADLKELDRENISDYIFDRCWVNDSVTGNASGSYTFNRSQAREYFFNDSDSDEYISDMISEGYTDAETVGQKIADSDWEWIDVCIRCYLLGEAVSAVLDEMGI